VKAICISKVRMILWMYMHKICRASYFLQIMYYIFSQLCYKCCLGCLKDPFSNIHFLFYIFEEHKWNLPFMQLLLHWWKQIWIGIEQLQLQHGTVQYLCNLPEIHAHAKVKDKNGYEKRYHFLVVVRLSILYMENVLRAKFSRQCGNYTNHSNWVNISALCKMVDSRVRDEMIFWTNSGNFFRNTCFVERNSSFTTTMVI